jgi:hypothetical protein
LKPFPNSSDEIVYSVSDYGKLSSLEDELQSLFLSGKNSHLSNSYPFILACAKELHADSDWGVHLTCSEKSTTGALFGRNSKLKIGPFNVPIYKIGTEFVGDIPTSPGSQDKVIYSLLTSILKTGNYPIIEFGNISESFLKDLTNCLDGHHVKYSYDFNSYGYTWDATISKEQMYKQLSSSRRQLVRRTRRRLASTFHHEIKVFFSTSIEENHAYLDQFLTLEATGWKGANGTAILHRPGDADYFRVIVESAAQLGMIRWYSLLVDGQVIAMNYCLQSGCTFWAPKIAYDENFSKYSPGLDLTHQIHLDCIENPDVKQINWISAPEWLDCWRPSRYPYYRLRIYDRSIMGRCLQKLTSIQALVRQLTHPEQSKSREKRYL